MPSQHPPQSEPEPPPGAREAELGRLLEQAIDLPAEQWRSFLEGAASEPAGGGEEIRGAVAVQVRGVYPRADGRGASGGLIDLRSESP